MTARAPNPPRACLRCGREFTAPKASSSQRFCGHSCAFAATGDNCRAAAATPAARARMADALRGTGRGNGYVKRNGRHEHRVVAEQKLGRPLRPGEIAHHRDEIKSNNDPANIDVLSSQAEHARLHSAGSKRPVVTTCKFGHSLAGDNVEITSAGNRRCVACRRNYDRQWKTARKEGRQFTYQPIGATP